jgi:two-component system, OmpR family, sensor histidine kinase ArlS
VKVRTRLTILFTVITGTILMAYAMVIYFSAKENREKEFFSLLEREAITKANLFLNANMEPKILQDIYKNNREILNEVEVAIYDQNLELIYHDAVDIDFVKETEEMLDRILQNGMINFYQENWQVLGLRYAFEDKSYIITAAALDEYGFNKLENLFRSSLAVFFISILLIFLSGRYFSKKAFEPIQEMTRKVKQITATNLDLRLSNNNTRDELSELVGTFNKMLDRLENSFDAQKHFVSNISHELRTPLAAIIAELELATHKERTREEYKEVIQSALNDTKKLVRLSNSLLDLAKASYDTNEISFKPVRIDEILLDARQLVLLANPEFKIAIQFEEDLYEAQEFSVNGNEYLLKIAFFNLLENGCKYSKDQQCSVLISFSEKVIVLKFSDKGIGIPEEEIAHIFKPFFRGSNQEFSEGSGIGLALVLKIIQLHQGNIDVQSIPGKGTVFKVVLPSL